MQCTSRATGRKKTDIVANEAIDMIESILTSAFAVTRHDEVDTLLDIEQVSM